MAIKVQVLSQTTVSPSIISQSSVDISAEGTVIKGDDGKSPYIGSNGTWMCYDDQGEKWIDTGIKAQGTSGVHIGPTQPTDDSNVWIVTES